MLTDNKKKEEIKFACKFTPPDSFHEIGCNDRYWSKKELQLAIINIQGDEEKKKYLEDKLFNL